MTLGFTVFLILGVIVTLLGMLYGRNLFSVFTLTEHKKLPDRFSDLLPWAMIVAPGVVFNKNGSFQTSFKFRGPDLDSATDSELVITTAQINNAFMRLRGGWAIYADSHRRPDTSYPETEWPDALTHLLDQERKILVGEANYFDSTRYLTLVYLPPPDVSNSIAQWFYEGGERVDSSYSDELKKFIKTRDEIVQLLVGVLKEIRVLDDDETCTYLHACVSPKIHDVAAPDTPMFIDSVLADTPLTGGFAPKLGDYHIQVLSLRRLPARLDPGRSRCPEPARYRIPLGHPLRGSRQD